MAMRTKIGLNGKGGAVTFCAALLCLLIGCKSAPPPGPILALYQKNGGPAFEKARGTYDPLVVDAFFRAHPNLLPSFIDHGVCSLRTDPLSPEAMPNGVICQSAMTVSMGISMKHFGESTP